jgi:hypothetical protein
MIRMFAQLLVLLAVLVMPLGMAPAATATPAQHHSAMPTGHCPGPESGHGSKAGFAECTMACSAALPAAEAPQDGPVPINRTTAAPEVVQRLHGLHPDTATPPPKHS